MEIYVIYNKNTGAITSSGRFDRAFCENEENQNGSTDLEYAARIVSEDADLDVMHLPNQRLPSHEKQKVLDGALVDLTEAEIKSTQWERLRRIEYNTRGATIEALTIAIFEQDQDEIDRLQAIRAQVKLDIPKG